MERGVRLKRRYKWLAAVIAAVFIAGCGNRSGSKSAPTPTPTPAIQGEGKKIEVRVLIDKAVPSLIDRYLEAQVVELTNGQVANEAQVAGSVSKTGIGHTQGLTNEVVLSVPFTAISDKDYGLRVGIFDDQARETMLLTADCRNPADCRYYPQSQVNSFQVKMIPAVEAKIIYDKGVPVEVRAMCQVQPNGNKCGVNRTMQYYDAVKDTCYGADWGSCEETKTFKSAADCLQACRKNW